MSKKRILIVDDLAIFREPISVALESVGYKAFCAENGREALRIIEASVQPFDLLVVDFSMPELDGLSFIRKARGYPHVTATPVVMLTDAADKDVVRQALQLGVTEYLLKSSFSLASLLEKVSKVIG